MGAVWERVCYWTPGREGSKGRLLQLRHCNVVIVGEKGSGKSSLVNSFDSAYQKQASFAAEQRPSQDHVTKAVYSYDVTNHVKLWDFWGAKAGYDRVLSLMIQGRLPFGTGYQAEESQIVLRDAPTVADEMHAMILVLSFNMHNPTTYPKEYERMQGLVKLAREVFQIPVVVLLTQCDHAPDVGLTSDLQTFFKSKAIFDACNVVQKALGLDAVSVLPVTTTAGQGRVVTKEMEERCWSIGLAAAEKVLARCDDFYTNLASGRIDRHRNYVLPAPAPPVPEPNIRIDAPNGWLTTGGGAPFPFVVTCVDRSAPLCTLSCVYPVGGGGGREYVSEALAISAHAVLACDRLAFVTADDSATITCTSTDNAVLAARIVLRRRL